jgi:thiamine biosynthesis protein ThiI
MTSGLLLVRYAEIHLKGQNRPFFEKLLAQNVMRAARAVCPCNLVRDQGRFFVTDYDPAREEELLQAVNRVFGVHSLSPAAVCEPQMEEIVQTALAVVARERSQGGRFKVDARRADKSFPLESPELARQLGGAVLKHFQNISVDVHDPAWKLWVEVRDKAYLYTRFIDGPGGMPVGTGGKIALLLSGGIDSPVAGYMLARRGVELEAVYFDSPPHTSERAKRKVTDLCGALSRYCGGIRLHVVHFTDVQEAIYTQCHPEFMTIIMRRFMMRIAERIARAGGAGALATGENLGQVASQTLQSIAATNAVCGMPVFRPLIAWDKAEIVKKAREIGTYEISILPYEDCCTVFVPRHPVTRPKLEDTERAESVLDVGKLCADALARVETIRIGGEETDETDTGGGTADREDPEGL